MENLRESPQHEMAPREAGNRQSGAESWEINYIPYSGGDSPFTIGEVKSIKGGGADAKWKSCYVPSPSSLFPWKATEDCASSEVHR